MVEKMKMKMKPNMRPNRNIVESYVCRESNRNSRSPFVRRESIRNFALLCWFAPRNSIPNQPFVIGVTGGTASCKTTLCDMIIQQLHDHRIVLVNQASFYLGLTSEKLKHVQEYNFDHPDAFDTEELFHTKSCCITTIPFTTSTHQRKSDDFRQVKACDVIILEGILVFHDSRVRDLRNMKIFVNTTGHQLNSRITSCSILSFFILGFPLFEPCLFWKILNDIVWKFPTSCSVADDPLDGLTHLSHSITC